MYINQSVVSLWNHPSEDGKTDEALYGMQTQVIRSDGNWSYVRMYYGYEGWLKSRYLSEDMKISQGKIKQVAAAWADVMEEPRVSSKVKITLSRGSKITALEDTKEGWQKITLWNGECGFLPSDFLRDFRALSVDEWKSQESLIRQKIITAAVSYMGVPYRWGGKTAAGIDCSGLAQMSYLMNGVIIYRDAKLLAGYAVHEIDPTKKKRADLLYFPGHMAIYLGNERYIHATAKEGCHHVTINSLDPKAVDYREDIAKQLEKVGSIF